MTIPQIIGLWFALSCLGGPIIGRWIHRGGIA